MNFKKVKKNLSAILAVSIMLPLLSTDANAMVNYKYLDKKGNVQLEIAKQYAYLGTFHHGLAIFQADSGYTRYGLINKEGQEVIPCNYEDIIIYKNRLLLNDPNIDSYLLADKKGNTIRDLNARYLDFSNSYFIAVGSGSNYDIYSTSSGKSLFTCESYKYVGEGIMYVTYKDDRNNTAAKFIDSKGKTIYKFKNTTGRINPKLDDQASFNSGLIPVQNIKTEKYGYLNKKGKMAIPAKYKRAHNFTKFGRAQVELDAKSKRYVVIDTKGKHASKRYSDMWADNSNMFCVVYKGCKGWLDKTGKEVIPCKYDHGGKFKQGIVRGQIEGDKYDKYYYINDKGKIIATSKNNADSFSDVGRQGIFAKRKYIGIYNDEKTYKWAIFDKNGKQLTKYKFDAIERKYNYLIGVNKSGSDYMKYMLDNKGKVVYREKVSYRDDSIISQFHEDPYVYAEKSNESSNTKTVYIFDKNGKPTVATIPYDGYFRYVMTGNGMLFRTSYD